MENKRLFRLSTFLVRLIFALILVYASYNPSGYSLFHWNEWIRDTRWSTDEFHFARIAFHRYHYTITIPDIIFITGWIIYAKIALRSFGGILLSLFALFFSTLVFCAIGLELFGDISTSSRYLLLFILSVICASGMHYSHFKA